MAREAQVDRRLQLDDPRPELVRDLMPEHEVAEEVEPTPDVAARRRSPVPSPTRGEELAVGESVRPRELRALPPLRVLLGRLDLRVPPREVRRERERREPRFGILEDRDERRASGGCGLDEAHDAATLVEPLERVLP